MPKSQFQYDIGIKIGSSVEVVLVSPDNGRGETILSREKAVNANDMKMLEEAMHQGTSIECKVYEVVKGGYMLNVAHNVKGFLPASLVQLKQVLVEGDIVSARVLRINKNTNSIILSKSKQMDVTQRHVNHYIKQINIGDILEACIKNITRFGIFVDLGGVDGLVHISDIAWHKTDSIESLGFSVGDMVKAKVLNIAGSKIFLGMKQVESDPWGTITDVIKVNDILEVTVTSIAYYGVFVNVKERVQGLIHLSEISWQYHGVNLSKKFKVGEKVKAKVIDISPELRKMALSIKACTPSPWSVFTKTYKVSDVLDCKVSSVAHFGVFVKTTPDEKCNVSVTILIHESEVMMHHAGYKKFEEVKSLYPIGESIQVKICSINIDKQKIGGGLYSKLSDDLMLFTKEHRVGSSISSEVSHLDKKGDLHTIIGYRESGLPGFIPSKNLLRGEYAKGQTINSEIVSINTNSKVVTMSMTEHRKQKLGKNTKGIDKVTLRDLIQEQLNK